MGKLTLVRKSNFNQKPLFNENGGVVDVGHYVEMMQQQMNQYHPIFFNVNVSITEKIALIKIVEALIPAYIKDVLKKESINNYETGSVRKILSPIVFSNYEKTGLKDILKNSKKSIKILSVLAHTIYKKNKDYNISNENNYDPKLGMVGTYKNIAFKLAERNLNNEEIFLLINTQIDKFLFELKILYPSINENTMNTFKQSLLNKFTDLLIQIYNNFEDYKVEFGRQSAEIIKISNSFLQEKINSHKM